LLRRRPAPSAHELPHTVAPRLNCVALRVDFAVPSDREARLAAATALPRPTRHVASEDRAGSGRLLDACHAYHPCEVKSIRHLQLGRTWQPSDQPVAIPTGTRERNRTAVRLVREVLGPPLTTTFGRDDPAAKVVVLVTSDQWVAFHFAVAAALVTLSLPTEHCGSAAKRDSMKMSRSWWLPPSPKPALRQLHPLVLRLLPPFSLSFRFAVLVGPSVVPPFSPSLSAPPLLAIRWGPSASPAGPSLPLLASVFVPVFVVPEVRCGRS
jgi:hypothetical protein